MLFSKTQSLYKRLEGAVALKDRNKKMKKRVSKANGCLFTEGKKEVKTMLTQEEMSVIVPEKLREIERNCHVEVLWAVESLPLLATCFQWYCLQEDGGLCGA